MKKKIVLLATELLKKLNINFLHHEISSFYDSHPHPNTIAFFSDILKANTVDNTIIQLNQDNISLFFSSPLPLVTFSNTNDGEFLLIEKVSENQISYFSAYSKRKTVSVAEFFEKWQGVVLIPFKETSGQPISWRMKLYDYLFLSSRIAPYLIVFAFLAYISFKYPLSLSIIFDTSALGILISALIFLYDNKTTNLLINKVCGDGEGCSDILTSNAAFVIGKLKWVDLSVAYFTSMIAIFCIVDNKDSLFNLFAFMSPLTILFSIYSLYYQVAVQKSICKFCISILAIFSVQTMVFLSAFKTINYPSILYSLSVYVILFSLILITWIFLEKELKSMLQFKKDSLRTRSIKFNVNAFNLLLLNEQAKLNNFNLEKSMYVGKDVSTSHPHQFTLFISLDCKPCKDLILEVSNWLDNPYENFSFHLVLSVGKEKNSPGYILASNFIEKYLQTGAKAAIDWVLQWYRSPYQLSPAKADSEIEAIINAHRSYKEHLNINSTPMVFYNDRKLPSEYSLSDLKFIIDI